MTVNPGPTRQGVPMGLGVSVVPVVSPLTVVAPHAVEDVMPDSGSETLQRTATYHPPLPTTPGSERKHHSLPSITCDDCL